jgi:predicted nucleic acid-binding protein
VAFIALLDANILFPTTLRNVVLHAVNHDLYQARFTHAILQEVKGSLRERYPDADAEREVASIRAPFLDALVTKYEHLTPAMLNDPKDRHVLAAAVRAGAQVLVTNNVRDFPAQSLAPYDIEVQTADGFLTHLWDLNPEAMAAVIVEAARMRKSRRSPAEVLDTLRTQTPQFVAAVLEVTDFNVSPPIVFKK